MKNQVGMMMNPIHKINATISFLDDVISDFEQSQLTERISINGNKASVIIDEFSPPPLLKNLRKILVASKDFLIKSYQNKFPANQYLKYFRLISEDGEKTSQAAAREITRGYWNKKWPFKVLEKGKEAIDKAIEDLNTTFSLFNAKIGYKPEQISKINPIKWIYTKKRYAESLSFDDIYNNEIIEELNTFEDDWIAEKYEKEEAIDKLRKILGKLGYSVDIENTEIYLDLLRKNSANI